MNLRNDAVCKLCRKKSELQESHVWPRFGYRDFVADQSSGGSFIDVAKCKTTNRQVKFYWYCRECEGKMSVTEKAAKELIVRMESADAPQTYDARLHKFLASISLRTVEFFHSNGESKSRSLERAFSMWRRCVLGKATTCSPYSQHVFVVFDQLTGLHRAMGGRILHDCGLVLSQVGPLIIVGFFDKSQLSVPDLKVWQRTEVKAEGGQLARLCEWSIGKNITPDFFKEFSQHEQQICGMVLGRTRKMGEAR